MLGARKYSPTKSRSGETARGSAEARRTQKRILGYTIMDFGSSGWHTSRESDIELRHTRRLESEDGSTGDGGNGEFLYRQRGSIFRNIGEAQGYTVEPDDRGTKI